ncbi:MAG: tRNA (adenosine(37)-N6)-threonylcarbamoyltransferase complex dimerization subunit type 1 TsaB [Candidatus Dormibacteraceae bacterium]
MVLVIDTSSARSAVAVLDGSGGVAGEVVAESGRGFDLPGTVRSLVRLSALTRIAAACGPGSFTGLRVGLAYAEGLGLGLGIPVLGLPTLALAAARARCPALGVSEAGRGRVYFMPPGAAERVGTPAEIPAGLPAAGWLREATAASLREVGVRLLEEADLRPFAAAAWTLIERAAEAGYGTLTPRYLQSFGALTARE